MNTEINSEFDTKPVDELAATDACPDKYAPADDIIAVLEKRILGIEDSLEELEARKRKIENDLKWEVEVLAEDKDNKLTNEAKRLLKYNQLCDGDTGLQALTNEIKSYRREVRKLKIELDNERRAFQLILVGA